MGRLLAGLVRHEEPPGSLRRGDEARAADDGRTVTQEANRGPAREEYEADAPVQELGR